MKQRQNFGGSIAEILVRLTGRLAFGLPTLASLGDRLEGAGLIRAPHRQAQVLAEAISVFDQFFFYVGKLALSKRASN